MSYRVLTDPAIPYVPALSGGLGATAEAPSTWRDVIFKLSEPFSHAVSQRIAYGKTDPYYSSFGPSPTFYQPGGSYPQTGFGIGGISPTTLLLGGAALVALMMLRK